MLGSLYYARQARTLLKMARVTKDPKLIATLISKASDLRDRSEDPPLAPELESDGRELQRST